MSLETILKGQKRTYECELNLDNLPRSNKLGPACRREAFASDDANAKYLIKTWTNPENFRSKLEHKATALLMANESHPNILIPEEVIEDQQGTHFVYPFMMGETVGDYRDKKRVESDVSFVFYILESTAAGLAHVHKQELIHGHVKPDNIFLQRNVQAPYGIKPILFDWDLTRRINDPDRDLLRLQLGTPAYMSPEQILYEPPQTSMDLCSLGIILFELLDGNLPVTAFDSHGYLHAYKLSPRRRIVNPNIPEAVKDVVHKMIQLRPGDRYQTLPEMVDAFRGSIKEYPHPLAVSSPAQIPPYAVIDP